MSFQTTHFLPPALMSLKIWILWKLEERDGKKTKVPYSPNYDGRASSINPRTWGTYDQAVRKFEATGSEFRGVGVMISKDFRLIGVDIDHCIKDDGSFTDQASDILSTFHNQYVEISQSGTGLHILALGVLPKSFKNSGNGVEMYCEKRFLALTGRAISVHDPHEEQKAIDLVYNKYRTPPKEKIVHKISPSQISKDDQSIIDRLKQDPELSKLYSGDWESCRYVSQSEADLRLCGALAFWTNADPERIDRIFRSSGLYRDKWRDRADYRESTISEACGSCKETLDEYVNRKRREEASELARVYFSEWEDQ